ncbi:MAG: WD40 repeat domain-containing protein [Anaerolineae bacterium]|nr:MAG: WD40 repeat domain-containing protein [Anaerolineae bacterium]
MKFRYCIALIMGLIFLASAFPYAVSAQDDIATQAYEVRWTGQWISVMSNDGLWLFDAENLEADPLHYFESTRIVVAAVDPVRNRMAVYDEAAYNLLIIEPTTGDVITEIPTDFAALGLDEREPARDLRYSDDGELLALVFPSRIIVYNAATSRERISYQNDLFMAIDSDVEPGTFVASTGYGMFLIYTPEVDYASGFFATAAISDNEAIYRLEILPATSEVLYQQGDSLMRTNLETDEAGFSPMIPLFDDGVFSFDLNNAGDTVAIASWEKIILYDLTTNATRYEISNGEDNSVFSLSFSDDGSQLATLDWAGNLQIWDVATGELLTNVYKFDYGSSVWAG